MLYDPFQREIHLPLTRTFHPFGFRVDIATNSEGVLAAAEESWGHYAAEFESKPVELRIAVAPGLAGGSTCPTRRAEDAPVVRLQRQLFTIVADRDNFGLYDSTQLFGYCFVTAETAADRAWFRFHFLELMAYMLLAQEHIMPLHAACVSHNGKGLLLYGPSGAGKSTLAWACARSGWTYITDDGAVLLPGRDDRLVLGRNRQVRFKTDAPSLFPELAAAVARTIPSGKVAVEVPVADFPAIRTASRSQVDAVIVLDRQAGEAPRLQPIPPAEPIDLLLNDTPWYGPEVHARYDRAVRHLLHVPAYRLTYSELAPAVAMLAELAKMPD